MEGILAPNFLLYQDSLASWGHRLKLCWVDPAFAVMAVLAPSSTQVTNTDE
jgi:hypothetical protein